MFDFTIKTERLLLRPFTQADAPRVRELAGDYRIAAMCAVIPHPYPEGLAESWIAKHEGVRAADKGYPFAVEKDGALIGSVGINAGDNGEFELGYWLTPSHWNQGLTTEATAGVLRFAFGWRALPFVRASFITENRASGRILDKAGFLATGRRQAYHTVRGCTVEVTDTILPRNAWRQDTDEQHHTARAA